MADTKVSNLTAVTSIAGADLVPVVQGGTSKKATFDQVKTYTNPTWYAVAAADQANSTVTPASKTDMELTAGTGTWLFKYWVCFRTAATTTGIQMHAKHTGTVTRLVATWYTLTTGGAAATGVADQATTATAQMMEGKGQRANDVASGFIQGVDTANSDQFAVMEGIVVVTASGTMQLMFASEVAASNATIMIGSTFELIKVA